MSTDQRAYDALRAFVREPVELSDGGLETVLAAIPGTAQQRSRLPVLDRGRSETMLSATKFIAASVILARSGGLLLSGVLTRPRDEQVPAIEASASTQAEATTTATAAPEPTTEAEADQRADATTRSDILPGADLVTEEIEPGVYRLIGDGVRDLTWSGELGWDTSMDVVAGHDGTVWMIRPEGMFKLGAVGLHPLPGDAPPDEIEVAADGTLWATSEGVLRSFDGERWNRERGRVVAFDLWPDGTIWAFKEPDLLLRRDKRGWSRHDSNMNLANLRDFWVRPQLDRALAEEYREEPGDRLDTQVLLYTDGRAGRSGLDVWIFEFGVHAGGIGPGGGVNAQTWDADIDPDRWAWLYQTLEIPLAGSGRSTETRHYLVHSSGGSQSVFTDEQGVPAALDHLRFNDHLPRRLLVAGPAGTVWLAAAPTFETDEPACDGVARFDRRGPEQRFLGGLCPLAMDITKDGTVWLLTARIGTVDGYPGQLLPPFHTYAITAEAYGGRD